MKGCLLCEGGFYYYLDMMNFYYENNWYFLFIMENE